VIEIAPQLQRPPVEDVQLYAVIVRKADLEMEYLAFAPGGRPAVFWTRALAAGFLQETLRQKHAVAGRVELWKVKRC
jgi:hypothetical protein